MNELDEQVIAEYRATGGTVKNAMGGHFKDVHLLLLHNVGKTSGREYVNPLLYVTDGDSYVLVGSNGGTETEPAWVANVEAMPEVTIEVGDRTLSGKPTVLRESAERDRLYGLQVEYWPDLLEYETHTSRRFPVVRVDPIA